MKRCAWAGSDLLMMDYHDKEWGVPVHDDRRLFEFLMLEGAQAGLSWITILRKRENYRKAFDSFDPTKIARYTQRDIKRLLSDSGIVRNRLKITAALLNARQFLEIQNEFSSFGNYIWRFTQGATIKHRFKSLSAIPAKTRESDNMSRDLQRRGFKFVGSTICYSFMQAVGIVNDHTTDCFRYEQVES
jgi:DNA-3-methyladenine glycosylase I